MTKDKMLLNETELDQVAGGQTYQYYPVVTSFGVKGYMFVLDNWNATKTGEQTMVKGTPTHLFVVENKLALRLKTLSERGDTAQLVDPPKD